MPSRGPPPLSLVAKALLLAMPGVETSVAAIALAQSLGEGSWAGWHEDGEELFPFEGTNNFGAVHATRAFADKYAHGATLVVGTPSVAYDEGWGMVAFLDHAPAPYVTRMAVYPSLFAGALHFRQLVSAFVNLGDVKDLEDYAAQLYVHNYYVGFHETRTLLENRQRAYDTNSWSDDDVANIADYAAAIGRNLERAKAAIAAAPGELGDPTLPTHGPPFAPLGVRLTPAQKQPNGQSYAPHTVTHARQILGTAASSPPAGGISVEDALASPRGDGTWMFPEGTPDSEQPPATAPELAAAIARSKKIEDLGGAAILGLALGAAGVWAGFRYQPRWLPFFGARA